VKFTGRKRFYDALDTCYRDGNAEAMVYLIDECLDKRLDACFSVFYSY
jgi:hypothetical protein